MKIEIEKPIIPRFVADWLEKERTSSPIHKSFPRAVDLVNHDNDWRNWANEVGGSWSRILATAWVKGYGIEQGSSLYYAKIKGWKLVGGLDYYWGYNMRDKDFEVIDITGDGVCTMRMAKSDWNELGINDTNADFGKVEDLKND